MQEQLWPPLIWLYWVSFRVSLVTHHKQHLVPWHAKGPVAEREENRWPHHWKGMQTRVLLHSWWDLWAPAISKLRCGRWKPGLRHRQRKHVLFGLLRESDSINLFIHLLDIYWASTICQVIYQGPGLQGYRQHLCLHRILSQASRCCIYIIVMVLICR